MLEFYVPIIGLNVNQMMCCRCNKVWLPRAHRERTQLLEDSGIKCALCSLDTVFADLEHVKKSRGEQFTRVVKPLKACKLFAIYPVSCLFIRSLDAGPIRLYNKRTF